MNHAYWYLSRAAGFNAYLLLFVSVALGIAMGTRLTDRVARRNIVFDLHRFTTLLALAFTVFHVYVLLGDGYFGFDVWQLSLPFRLPYRTLPTAIGVLALYTMVLVTLSFYVRRFIGYRAWRTLHYLTFGLFAAAALHGITAGSDTTQRWAQLIYLGTGGAVLALIAYRLQYRLPNSEVVRQLRLLSGIATVVMVCVLLGAAIIAVAQGRRSAIGADSSVVQQDVSPPPSGTQHPFLDTFSDELTAYHSQTDTKEDHHLTIDGITHGAFVVKVHIELETTSGTTGVEPTVRLNTGQFRDFDSNQLLCDGQLTTLRNGLMRMTCTGAGPYQGVQISIASRLSMDTDTTLSGTVSGTMQRTP